MSDVCHEIENWCAAHDRPARHVADGEVERRRAAAQVLLIRGRCLRCDGEVVRDLSPDGDYLTIGAWRHYEPVADDHRVSNVLPPA